MVRALPAATAFVFTLGCGLDWTVPDGDPAGGRGGASASTGTWHEGNAGGEGAATGGTSSSQTTTVTSSSTGGAPASSSSASTASSGGAAPCDSGDTSKCGECETCAANGQCATAESECDANADCPALFDCYFSCDTGDGFCQNGCYAGYAGGITAFENLASCLYCEVCVVSCGPTPRCQ